jgi:hypothetical protein
MYYKLYADGTIQGRAGLPQEGWEQHEECPFEHGKMVKGKWVEDIEKTEAIAREELIQKEMSAIIRKQAEDKLTAEGKINAK